MDFTGPLNYANPAHQYDGSESDRAYVAERIGRPTQIQDARPIFGRLASPQPSTDLLCDGVGFLLAHAPSRVKDWTDAKDVAAVYYDECQKLLEALMPGAEVPSIQSHTYRNEEIKDHHWIDGIQYGPCATGVHNDYADFVSEDGTTVTRKFSELMQFRQDRRVIGINIWRSVSPEPLARFPLAVCDRTSIDVNDLEYDLNPNAKPEPFNAHFCKPNDRHRWYYYSGMTNEESLVFTTYDSHPENGVFCPTLHTAVPIPGSEGFQPRQSVEVRFFVELPGTVT